MGMGICCPKRTGIDRDNAKIELETIGASNRNLRPPAPLIDGVQVTFKNAAASSSTQTLNSILDFHAFVS
jgi:hypothetical protein